MALVTSREEILLRAGIVWSGLLLDLIILGPFPDGWVRPTFRFGVPGYDFKLPLECDEGNALYVYVSVYLRHQTTIVVTVEAVSCGERYLKKMSDAIRRVMRNFGSAEHRYRTARG